jgi:hypothetical protein
MNKQRTVSNELGKNITKYHTQIYDEIEKRIGKTKKCTFGHARGSKTGVKHEGCIDINIRDFELRNATLDNVTGCVIINGDGLQGFCRQCSKRRRQARILKEKVEKQDKTPEEIYALYTQKYGMNVKKCSRCELDKELCQFNLSIGMECGLHNVCRICSYVYGSSVGDRSIIYMPDDPNYKYKKDQSEQHDDHIFPLSLGGSNNVINHQLLSSAENLRKSNGIDHFVCVENINPELLCVRFRGALLKATDLTDLKVILNQYIHADILRRSLLTDDELYDMYQLYYKQNNMRKDIHRVVKKFREYCTIRGVHAI